ncbi:MAG: SNF2-related protein, partial [Candidatus Riflebacteria bacterium]
MNSANSEKKNIFESVASGKGIPLLTHPKIESLKNQAEFIDFGSALQMVLAGETAGLHVLAGFFSHRSLPPDCSNSFTTDALVTGELLEHSCWQKKARARFSLAYGELKSVQSALAIQSWYWLCRWYQNKETALIAEDFLLKSFAELDNRPEQVSGIIKKLVGFPVFARWFSENAGKQSQEIFEELKERNQAIEGALEAASRLFSLFCLRHADVRWGGADINGLFHPKVYVVERGRPGNDSYILMGSGNWSNSAFHATEQTGNVEIGVALKLPGLIWQNLEAAEQNDTGVRLVQTSRIVFAGCAPIASFESELADEETMLKATQLYEDSDSFSGQFPSAPAAEEISGYLRALAILKNFVAEKIGYQNLAGVLEGTAPYQEEGAARLVAMLERDRGAILADSTGLGKTWVAMRVIAHYAALMTELKVALIVPNQTVLQWQSEIERCGLNRVAAKINVIGHGFLQKKDFCDDHLHLLESNLVIIDESHNFRNAASNRVGLLRSLLRLNYPENDGQLLPRRTLLLSATPINNRLEDLHTQLGLFRISSRDMKKIDSDFRQYLKQKIEAQVLLKKIFNRSGKTGYDPIKLCSDGWAEIEINDAEKYFREQEEKLEQISQSDELQHRRILDSLLNRLVVKRNRSQCQLIDEKSGMKQLFFRQPSKQPEKIQIQSPREAQLLIKLLRMFRGSDNDEGLKFAVHRWNLLGSDDSGSRRENLESFQKFLFLKRLESSSMALLQTLVRLAGLHALRLKEALDRCFLGRREVNDLLSEKKYLGNLAAFWAVEDFTEPTDFITGLAEKFARHRPASDYAEDEDAVQVELDFANADSDNERKALSFSILHDFSRLAQIITELTRIILGPQKEKWPIGL